MPFAGIWEILEPCLRGAVRCPKEALFQKGSRIFNIRGSSRSSPAKYFFFLKFFSFGTFEKSGGVMVRPHFPSRCKIGETTGRFPTPRVMDRQVIATLKPKKYPSLGFNVAKSVVSVPPLRKLRAQAKNRDFFDDDDDENPPHHRVAPRPPPSPL